MKEKVVAGVDIGGTNICIALVDNQGKVLKDCFVELKTNTYKNNIPLFIDDIYKNINALLGIAKKRESDLLGIGIGAPSGNHITNCIDIAGNLPWSERLSASRIQERFPSTVKVKINNDANAAAIAEMLYGEMAKEQGNRLENFLFITLGTGLGSGFVTNGKMIYGHDGLAGELGHVIVVENGRECNCGRRGCLETYVSATGIKRTVFELLCNSAKYDNSELRNITFNNLSAVDIDKAACNGDGLAKQVFEITGKMLGKWLANMTAITSPSVIFLFGGLANAGDLILEPTRSSFAENLLFLYRDEYKKPKTEILLSSLGNKDAGVLGAAALVWENSL